MQFIGGFRHETNGNSWKQHCESSYYGVRTMLKTRDGLYTNAIFGFLNILTKLLDEEKPEAVCVTFDLHAPTFRHKAYDEYKAGRHAMPDELRMQMPVLKKKY